MGVRSNPDHPNHSETIDRLLLHALELAKLRDHTMLVYLIDMAMAENTSGSPGAVLPLLRGKANSHDSQQP